MARVAAPVQLKILHGRGQGKDGRPRDSGGRAIDQPPPFRRLAPQKPKGLSKRAAAHWDEIVPELTRLELLTEAHVGGLVMMCEAYSIGMQATDLVKREGIIVREVRNPAIMVATQAWKEYRGWAVQFGLTPAAEGRLKPKEADGGEDNPFE